MITTTNVRSWTACSLFLGGMLFGSLAPMYAQPAAAQDTLPHYIMESVVVTADRFQNKVARTTSSMSVLGSGELSRLPANTLSEALQYVPGFFVFNQDGLGRDPIVSTRGFYGGGEAEYVLVLVDGKQVNDLETGLVNWNLVPLRNIGHVEVSRGASSPLYGDASLGGVIDIGTSSADLPPGSAYVQGGTFGTINAGVDARGKLGNNPFQISLSNQHTDGFRGHSGWRGSTLSGDLTIPVDDVSKLRFSTVDQLTKSDDAGPLTQDELNLNRSQSSPYYRFDGKDDKRYQIQTEYSRYFSNGGSLSGRLFYNRKDGDDFRTFATQAETLTFNPANPFSPSFDTTLYGDTKERVLHSNEEALNVKYELSSDGNRFVVGFDGSYGRLQSTYHARFSGFEYDYARQSSERDSVVADGAAKRSKYALYFNDELLLSQSLSLNMGERFDAIDDSYDGTFPNDTSLTAHQSAFSPRAGLNYRFADGDDYSGSAYTTVNWSFKSPTMDQFADQRPITAGLFIPIGPAFYKFKAGSFSPFSNPLLKPQRGTTYELGTYQRMKFQDNLSGEVMLSLYQMDMEDEIDFDFTTFKYQNIQQSRHQGAEFSLRLYNTPGTTVFANYTWSSVKFTAGPNDGNYLKAIPRNVVTLGGTATVADNVTAALTWNFVSTMYLDDQNTGTLPNYKFGNLKVSYTLRPVTFSVGVNNVLDSHFSYTGYNLYGMTFLSPAAGRSVLAGIAADF